MIDLATLPDQHGHFGPYGGMFVPETLMTALNELTEEYLKAREDAAFQRELSWLLQEYAGRPTPLYFAERLTRELGGAKVVEVTAGQQTLKEAINEAMRDWVTNVRTTHYILGSALGSHPYPMMVRDFHRVIGDEARRQIMDREGRLPDLLVACVGGGSNASGLFHPFLEDASVRMGGGEPG